MKPPQVTGMHVLGLRAVGVRGRVQKKLAGFAEK